MKRFFQIIVRNALAGTAVLLAGVCRGQEVQVHNDGELRLALASTYFIRVVIVEDITLRIDDDPNTAGAQLLVPQRFSLEFSNNAKLRKGRADMRVHFNGSLPSREAGCHYFDSGYTDATPAVLCEWMPGEIRGLIGGQARRAEWWGANASTEKLTLADRMAEDDTKAINCATGAIPQDYMSPPSPGAPEGWGDGGFQVQLRPGFYYISAPIFASGSRCNLLGAPPIATNIRAYENPFAQYPWRWRDGMSVYHWCRCHRFFGDDNPGYWDWTGNCLGTWYNAQDKTTGWQNQGGSFTNYHHVAMIYTGGLRLFTGYGGVLLEIPPQISHNKISDFAAGVADLDLEAVPGGVDHPSGGGAKMPMSLISQYEPLNTMAAFTGLEENSYIENIRGRGFSGYGIGFSWSGSINGLHIRNFELGPPDTAMLPTATPQPIFLPQWTGVCVVEDGIIKAGRKCLRTYTDGTGVHNVPDYDKFDVIAITAQGYPRIRDVKIYDAYVGVELLPNDGCSGVTVEDIEYAETPPISANNYPPRSSVVRLRRQYYLPWAATQISGVVTNVFGNFAYPSATPYNGGGISLLLDTADGPFAFVPKSCDTILYLYARKFWPDYSTLGPYLTPP